MGTWGLEVSKEPYCLSQAVGLFLIWMKLLSDATCFCPEIGLVYFFQLCEVPVREKYELSNQMDIKETDLLKLQVPLCYSCIYSAKI